MSKQSSRLILIPGLFDHLADWKRDFDFVPQAPGLVKQLAGLKKHKFTTSGYLPTLYSLVDSASYARDCYEFDFGTLPDNDNAVLCATPIQLEAGLNDIAIGSDIIDDLDTDEISTLLTELNQHFSQDGWEFVHSENGRWYLLLPETHLPEVTIPLDQALGASLRGLVEGNQELQWNRQLNEMQMLLYGSRVNQQREHERKAVINSFWLWDVDIKDNLFGEAGFDYMVGGGYQGQVLAKKYGVSWTEFIDYDYLEGRGLLIFDELKDLASLNELESWQEQLTELEPILLELFNTGSNDTTLYSSHGLSWSSQKSGIWNKLFQRKKSLLDLI